MIKLMQGDCLELMKGIPDGSVDLILTDPPYGTTSCKWDTVIPFDLMWAELKRVIKPNGAIVLFGSEPFSSALRMSNIKQYKYDWVWDKVLARGHLVAKRRPMQQSENILVFGASLNYYPQMTKGGMRNKKSYGMSSESAMGFCNKSKDNFNDQYYPKNILTFSNAKKSERGLHPTQKPVDLLEYLIKTYTQENETVLDFTMGSGSTGVAAKNLNRSFIGIELDENYFRIAKERIGE